MKKKILSMALAVALVLGLGAPVLAVGPTFSDVPESYWGYADIEAAAEAGLMNGTGNGAFSPEVKVSVAQFLTLLGRLVFPEIEVNEGDTWFGPYVAACNDSGLLDGTQLVATNNLDAEISRYDMAVILRAAAKKLGVAEKTAQSGEVTDYGLIPNMYTDAVLAVYGMGLIKGDQAGNFNGGNTMMRAEVATVIMRLKKAAPGSSQGGTAEPTTALEPPVETDPPAEAQEPQMVTAEVWGSLCYYPTQGNASWDKGVTKVAGAGIPFKILYTEDGGETSTLMGESETTEITRFELEFQVDKRLLDNPNGQFYISAQFEKDGQLFVTQDLRTDGRKGLCVVHLKHGVGGDDINLVPPTGQRWDFELKGSVPHGALKTFDDGTCDYRDISTDGFTVQFVYYPSPNIQDKRPTGEKIVLGKTVADKDGKFVLPVSIDTLDMVRTQNFRVEFSGTYDGTHYYTNAQDSLYTLSDIWVANNKGGKWGAHLDFDE